MLRVAADIFDQQLWIADRGGYPADGLGEELPTTHSKK
jgi:hypothetical protein